MRQRLDNVGERRCHNVRNWRWYNSHFRLCHNVVTTSTTTLWQRCHNVAVPAGRANLYHHVLIQVNAMPILNVTNSLRWVQTQSTKNLDGREQQRWTAPRECKDQWKVQNNYQKECTVFICSGTIKIKYKKLFLHLLTLQTWADVIVRLTKIKKRCGLEIESHDKLLEIEFMIHDKCYRNYTRLPKDEAIRSLKLQVKNVNTKNYFFTISAYNNFLEFFWVKLSTKTSFLRYFSRPNRTTLFASKNIVSIKPFILRCWNSW